MSEKRSIWVENKKYELLRFWLLGSWMAHILGLDFRLVSLVLNAKEKEIETTFSDFIIEDNTRQFSRLTWEDIYCFIVQNNTCPDHYNKIVHYFNNKCLGYNENQMLIKAFEV